jgi:hypothetical protein
MKFLVLITLLFTNLSAFATDEATEKDNESIKTCLKKWGNHPFKDREHMYRTLESGFQVFGGGNNTEDMRVTDRPELVLVKGSVTALGSKKFILKNPKGWYCLDNAVTVLGSTQIELACGAQLAGVREGATILGSSKAAGAVTVLGSTKLERDNNCAQTL